MDLSTHPPKPVKKSFFLTPGSLFALYYHDLFSYPLKKRELKKWEAGSFLTKVNESFWLDFQGKVISHKQGFFFFEGKKELITRRLLREKISQAKIKIARKAARFLAKIPWIWFVGVTGSLAMNSAHEEDDIDLMLITAPNTLWLMRPLSYFVLLINGFSLRRFGVKEEKDQLCLNIWLDATKLTWEGRRNVYTAHEIAQIIPLVNKKKTYQQFLWKNKWFKNFWPRAAKVVPISQKSKSSRGLNFLNSLAFWLQYKYMENKITREKVNLKQALFHPYDWSQTLSRRLKI